VYLCVLHQQLALIGISEVLLVIICGRYDIQLIVLQDLEQDESMNSKPTPKKQSIQLNDCLELFTTRETLSEHDLWYIFWILNLLSLLRLPFLCIHLTNRQELCCFYAIKKLAH
jgi:hypothetical protein